jgi:hypothetical protein
MSSVSGVDSMASVPVINHTNKPVGNSQPQPQSSVVQPVSKDADGDNDGRVGKNIDVRA